MDLQKFLYGLLWMILSVLAYKYHKWWLKKRIEKSGELDNYDKTLGIVKSWGAIIFTSIVAIIYFLEALKLI